MATYKVLQDIEAEDKLVGPLTLRQCIYAAVAATCMWLAWLSIARGLVIGALFFLPFIGTAVFFAFPWRKEQSTEVWALAKVRFMFKPRKRIWDQTGAKELVTVTAPRQVVTNTRRRLSEDEVRGRLKALADTVDSRGWAVKNVPLDMYLQTGANMPTSDRLISGTSLPNQVSIPDAVHSSDIFDMAVSPVAQQFEQRITAAANAHREELLRQVDHPEIAPAAQPAGQQQWFASQQPQGNVPTALDPNAEELALAEEIKRKQQMMHDGHGVAYGHMRVIQPLDMQGRPQGQAANVDASRPDQQANFAENGPVIADPNNPDSLASQAASLMGGNMASPAMPQAAMPMAPPMQQQWQNVPAAPAPDMPQQPQYAPQSMGQAPTPLMDEVLQATTPVTPPPNPAILGLANNNDLDIATIAREAQRQNGDTVDEVVIPLH